MPHVQVTTGAISVRCRVREAESFRGLFGGSRFYPHRFDATNLPLRDIVKGALGLRRYQLSGGPAWLDSERFDVRGVAGRPVSPDELQRMLRTLVLERFNLRVHTASAQISGWNLVVSRSDGKLGPAMKPCDARAVPGDERMRTSALSITSTPPVTRRFPSVDGTFRTAEWWRRHA